MQRFVFSVENTAKQVVEVSTTRVFIRTGSEKSLKKSTLDQHRDLIKERFSEHGQAVRLGQIETSLIAKHSINEEHNINWENSATFSFNNHLVPRLVKELIKIFYHKGRALKNGTSLPLS